MKKVTILFFSCNRLEYLKPMLEDFHEKMDLSGVEVHKILIDDYPKGRSEEEFRRIQEEYAIDHLELNEENLGLSASWAKVWTLVPEDTDYIWHQEDDFLFNKSFKLLDLIRIFEASPTPLTQLCLKRQQWYSETHDFTHQITNKKVGREIQTKEGDSIIIHKHYFNANPCLYPRWVIEEQYPHNPQESVIVNHLKQLYPERYSAILGKPEDPPLVKHIGEYNQGKKVLEGEPGWDWLKNYNPDKQYYSRYYCKEYNKN